MYEIGDILQFSRLASFENCTTWKIARISNGTETNCLYHLELQGDSETSYDRTYNVHHQTLEWSSDWRYVHPMSPRATTFSDWFKGVSNG